MENKLYGKWKAQTNLSELGDDAEKEGKDLIEFSGDEEPTRHSTPKEEPKLTEDDLIVLFDSKNRNSSALSPPSDEVLIPNFFSDKIDAPAYAKGNYPEFTNYDLTLSFYVTLDWLTIMEKCIRDKPTVECFDKYTKELKSIMLNILSASPDFRRRFYRIMETNVYMDYGRTLKRASEVLATMRKFVSEEEMTIMDGRASGYMKMHERTMSEPFDKFLSDRINGFAFK